MTEARRALDSDPLSLYALTIFAIALGMAGKGEEAIATAHRSIEADPDSYIALWALGQTLAWSGRPEEAVATHRRGAEKAKSAFSLAPLASALARAGRPAEALAVHEEITARAASEHVSPSQLALTAAAAGLDQDALAFARQAWATRDPFLYFARHYPDYEWHRGRPEFQTILKEMNA